MDGINKPPKLIGTPLSSLLKNGQADEDSGPINRRRQRLERNQIVQDDQGRRRFHGAFTGGFSAGYHNTVDSVQGFQPRSFTSRRGAGSAQGDGLSFRHRPEDYMDEEDFGEFGIAPKKVRLAGQFSEASKDAKSKFGIPLVVNDSIGEKILRHMTRNRIASCQKQTDNQIFKPKNDYHGLGYKPLISKHPAFGDGSTQSALEASLKSGVKLKISGEAFGVGVLDEDEDNLHNINEYGQDDCANYDFGHHKSSRLNEVAKRSANLEASSRKSHSGDLHLLPGFELSGDFSAMELCDKECLEYPLPIIEEGWKMPVRTEPIMMPPEESDLNRKNIDSYTNRIISFNDRFTRGESSRTKKESHIEGRSGLVLYTDLKTFAEPVIEHEHRPTDRDAGTGISISRKVVDWHPCSLLCKHFGVENPYPDSRFCGVKSSDLRNETAKQPSQRSDSKQSTHEMQLAPIEIRKSIFNVYFRDPDDSSDSENEPQVVELDSDGIIGAELVDCEATRPRDSDSDPEIVVMDVPKREPEVIVLSSSGSSKSSCSSPQGSTDDDLYGPPLPPSKQTLKGLSGSVARSDKSRKRKRHKSKSHKKKKKNKDR